MSSCPFNFVLLDLDGTLVDSLPGISYSFQKALSDVFPDCPTPDISNLVGPHIREIFRQAINWEVAPYELDALEAAYRRSYDADGCLRTEVYPDVMLTLDELVRQGIECRIVTNKPLIPTKAILSRLNLKSFFVEVVTPDSKDPNFNSKTEAVQYLTQRRSYPAQQTLFVGDSLDDALAARAAGFRFASADYGFGLVSRRFPDLVDFRLPTFSSLLAITSACDKSL